LHFNHYLLEPSAEAVHAALISEAYYCTVQHASNIHAVFLILVTKIKFKPIFLIQFSQVISGLHFWLQRQSCCCATELIIWLWWIHTCFANFAGAFQWEAIWGKQSGWRGQTAARCV